MMDFNPAGLVTALVLGIFKSASPFIAEIHLVE